MDFFKYSNDIIQISCFLTMQIVKGKLFQLGEDVYTNCVYSTFRE